MKKLMIILGIMVLLGTKLNAQTTITDTSSYFKDSIMAKKNYYVGKPLSVLIKDLKIGIVREQTLTPTLGITDTFYTKKILLTFLPPEEFLSRTLFDHQIAPILSITFQDTLAIPRHYFKPGGVLDDDKYWTRNKRNYWGQFIVADIRLSGVK
jgi:hypothetical protein